MTGYGGGTDGHDQTWLTPGKPEVTELQREYKSCFPGSTNWNGLLNSDETRYCYWPNQSPDGKKYDEENNPAFPFNGASDARIHLVDSIINERVATLGAAFWRANLSAHAIEPGDMPKAAQVNTLLRWARQKMLRNLVKEVELAAQYQGTYGWTVLMATWERDVTLQMRELTLDMFRNIALAVAEYDQANPLAQLPQMILDPTLEEQAIPLLEQLYLSYVQMNRVAVLMEEIPKLKKSTLKRVIRELREEGRTELPVPYVTRDQPVVRALKPWDEVFIPFYETDIQTARVFVRYLMTEEELRAKAEIYGWDQKWVEQAVLQKGKISWWQFTAPTQAQQPYTWAYIQNPLNNNLIEVLYAYTTRMDDNGCKGVYCTVFQPEVSSDQEGNNDLVAKHELLNYHHGKMPFVDLPLERIQRSFVWSRPIPQIGQTWQREMKVQHDGLTDRTSFTTLPPILVPTSTLQSQWKFGPGQPLPVQQGREPKFMDIPRGDGTALELLQQVKTEADEYFGRANPNIPAVRTQVMQEQQVNHFLKAWSEVFEQVFQLMQQFMTEAELERIVGSKLVFEREAAAIAGQFDIDLTFDVRELDVDYTAEKLKRIVELVPMDVGGVINRNELIKMAMNAIDPRLARELITDSATASQQLFIQVRDEIAQMYLGNEPMYVENDPTAPTKLQYAQQVVMANPDYQEALRTNPRFAELMGKYAKNLTFSVQQQQNKQVGRIGVQPQVEQPMR